MGGGKDRSILPAGASALAANETVYIRTGIFVIAIIAQVVILQGINRY